MSTIVTALKETVYAGTFLFLGLLLGAIFVIQQQEASAQSMPMFELYEVECSDVACIRWNPSSGQRWVLAGNGPATWRWVPVTERAE